LARAGRRVGCAASAAARPQWIRGAHGDRNRARTHVTTTPAQGLHKGHQRGHEKEGKEKGNGNEATVVKEDQERIEEESEEADTVRRPRPSYSTICLSVLLPASRRVAFAAPCCIASSSSDARGQRRCRFSSPASARSPTHHTRSGSFPGSLHAAGERRSVGSRSGDA
jgi:hypothetical protein